MDWLWIVFEIVNSAFEIFMMKILAEGFLKHKRVMPKIAKTCVIVSAISATTWASFAWNGNYILMTSIMLLIAFLVSTTFCCGKKYWYYISAITYCILMATSEMIALYTISALRGVDFSDIYFIGVYRYQAIVVVDIILFFYVKLICRLSKTGNREMPIRFWLILCLLPFLSVLIMLQMIFGSNAASNSVTPFSILITTSVLIINILIFYESESVVRHAVNKERISALERQLSLQKEHVQKVVENRSQIEQMSHDFKHHIQTFQALSETGQYEELAERIRELSLKQAHIRPMLDTKNPTLDALLSVKRETAERAGIEWVWDINIPPKLSVPIVDVCAILGNALDNAIEACLRTDENRRIALTVNANNHALLLGIRNTIGLQPISEDGFFLSRKKDGKLHGIGLNSMKEYCKRLNGDISFDYDDDEFELRVLIPRDEFIPITE